MRLPYIQVTQETWSKARMLGGLAGVETGVAFMAICELWQWGLELGPPDIAPTGICSSERADILLTAAIGWDVLRASEWVDMLADIGLVERLKSGIRVRGLDRYGEAWERNQSLRERWRRANEKRKHPDEPSEQPRDDLAVTADLPRGNREVAAQVPRGNRDVTDSKPLPKTQTQTHIKEKDPPPKSAAPPKTEKPTDPRHAPLVASLCKSFKAIRGADYGFTSRDAKCVADLLALGTPDEVERRWCMSLRHQGFPTISRLADLSQFWNTFAGTGPPANGKTTRASEEDKRWEGRDVQADIAEFMRG